MPLFQLQKAVPACQDIYFGKIQRRIIAYQPGEGSLSRFELLGGVSKPNL